MSIDDAKEYLCTFDKVSNVKFTKRGLSLIFDGKGYGIQTDGIHNPVDSAKLLIGEIEKLIKKN